LRLRPPFHAHGEHIAIDLDGARALFTTRRGGVSAGAYASLNLGLWTDDEPERVRDNRARVAQLAGISPGRLAFGRQVHGARVRRLPAPPDPAGTPPDADGQATSVHGVAPTVLVADCLPIALACDGAVAMLHGGWRGLASDLVAEGVAALRELGGRGPIVAAIGPGAGRCCYEVGEEVRAALADHGPGVCEGDRLDLKLVARRALERAGVGEVHDVDLCTICASAAPLFFSHRRDAGVTGRQAGVVCRAAA
jgi:YfiH family protein